jgi:hypothetical protein
MLSINQCLLCQANITITKSNETMYGQPTATRYTYLLLNLFLLWLVYSSNMHQKMSRYTKENCNMQPCKLEESFMSAFGVAPGCGQTAPVNNEANAPFTTIYQAISVIPKTPAHSRKHVAYNEIGVNEFDDHLSAFSSKIHSQALHILCPSRVYCEEKDIFQTRVRSKYKHTGTGAKRLSVKCSNNARRRLHKISAYWKYLRGLAARSI